MCSSSQADGNSGDILLKYQATKSISGNVLPGQSLL